MNTNTPRHTARPSRSRVLRAVVSAWYNRHADALAWCSLIAFTVAFSVAFTYALIIDAPSVAWITDHRALAFVGIAFAFVAFAFVVGAFVHLLTHDITARQLSRAHARTLARVSIERDLEEQTAQNVEDCLRADIARLTRERDALRADHETARRALTDARFMLATARDERDALAYVVSQLVSAVESTRATMRERVLDAWLSRDNDEHDDQHAVLAELSVLILRADENAYLARYDA